MAHADIHKTNTVYLPRNNILKTCLLIHSRFAENQLVMQIGTGTRAESIKICKNMAGYGMTDNLYIQYKI
jgi:hypothetical protein